MCSSENPTFELFLARCFHSESFVGSTHSEAEDARPKSAPPHTNPAGETVQSSYIPFLHCVSPAHDPSISPSTADIMQGYESYHRLPMLSTPGRWMKTTESCPHVSWAPAHVVYETGILMQERLDSINENGSCRGHHTLIPISPRPRTESVQRDVLITGSSVRLSLRPLIVG